MHLWQVFLIITEVLLDISVTVDQFYFRFRSNVTYDTTGLSGTSVNERTGQSDMKNVVYNWTLTYGTCKIYRIVYSFCINLYGRKYISGTTNQRSDKKDNNLTTPIKLGAGTKTFSIIFTHVILSMCYTESYCTRWQKGIKYAPPSAIVFPWYIRCNSRASKRVYFVRTRYKEYNIFIWCCF